VALKEVAVQGAAFKYTITCAPPNYSVQDPADGQIITPPSAKVKAGGKGVHENGCQFQCTVIAPVTQIGGAVAPPSLVASGSFNSTAVKTKADGKPVLLKGDKTSPIVVGPFNDVNSASGVTVPVTVTLIAEIDNPGQTKVKAQ